VHGTPLKMRRSCQSSCLVSGRPDSEAIERGYHACNITAVVGVLCLRRICSRHTLRPNSPATARLPRLVARGYLAAVSGPGFTDCAHSASAACDCTTPRSGDEGDWRELRGASYSSRHGAGAGWRTRLRRGAQILSPFHAAQIGVERDSRIGGAGKKRVGPKAAISDISIDHDRR
jgi:hypothetical protein